MPKPSLMSIASEQYEKISELYLTGRDDQLNEEQIAILRRWKAAYMILEKYPAKYIAITKLQELYPISETQAATDIQNAMKFWNKNNSIDRDFLHALFINKLLEEITKPNADESAKAKNFSTLQKYLKEMPAQEIDPKHIEKNNINICFNIANQNFVLNEKELYKLPKTDVVKLMDSLSYEIVEAEAEEIMNT
jgi:hypothetical protein